MSFFKRLWDNPTDAIWEVVSEYPQTSALATVASFGASTYAFYRSGIFQKYKVPIAVTSGVAAVAGTYYGYCKIKPLLDELKQAQEMFSMMNGEGSTKKLNADQATMQDEYLMDKSSNSLDVNWMRYKRVLEAAANGYIAFFTELRPTLINRFKVELCREGLQEARKQGNPIAHLECIKFSAMGRILTAVYLGTFMAAFQKVQLSILSRFQQFDLLLRKSLTEKKKALSARRTREGASSNKSPAYTQEIRNLNGQLGPSGGASTPTLEEEEISLRLLTTLVEDLSRANDDFLRLTERYLRGVLLSTLSGLAREAAVTVGARNAVNSATAALGPVPSRAAALLSARGAEWASEEVDADDARALIRDLRVVLEDGFFFRRTAELQNTGAYLHRLTRFTSPSNTNPASSFALCVAEGAQEDMTKNETEQNTSDSDVLLLDSDPACSAAALQRFASYMALDGRLGSSADELTLGEQTTVTVQALPSPSGTLTKSIKEDNTRSSVPSIARANLDGETDELDKASVKSNNSTSTSPALLSTRFTSRPGSLVRRPFCSVLLLPHDAIDMEAEVAARCPNYEVLPMTDPSASYPARFLGIWAELSEVLQSDAFVSALKHQLDINFSLLEREIVRLRFTSPEAAEKAKEKEKSTPSTFTGSTSTPGELKPAGEEKQKSTTTSSSASSPAIKVSFLKLIMGYISMFDSVWVKKPRVAPISMLTKELTDWSPVDEVCKVVFLPLNETEAATIAGKDASAKNSLGDIGGALNGLFSSMGGVGGVGMGEPGSTNGMNGLGLGDLGDFSPEELKELEGMLKALEGGGF